MAIKKKKKTYQKCEIDLTGPNGNAFYVLGQARSLAKQLDLNWEPINEDMMSGDYEHLIQVFDKHFGEVVDLVR
jgi:hypothetical protein